MTHTNNTQQIFGKGAEEIQWKDSLSKEWF